MQLYFLQKIAASVKQFISEHVTDFRKDHSVTYISLNRVFQCLRFRQRKFKTNFCNHINNEKKKSQNL